MEHHYQPLEILVIDDSPGDVGLLEAAFQEWQMVNNVNVVEDGEQAIQYLLQEEPYRDVTQPDLILLDLNLPKKDGKAVLAEIKVDERTKHIPVVVLTTSNAEKDILESYRLHANCYITKPVHMDDFFQKIHAIEDFWMKFVQLPPRQISA